MIKNLGMCKGNWKVFHTRLGRISHVSKGGHKGQYCICGEYGEPIHVEGRFTELDGHEMHHEVLEKHFGLQIN
jgi:hypothetical protein